MRLIQWNPHSKYQGLCRDRTHAWCCSPALHHHLWLRQAAILHVDQQSDPQSITYRLWLGDGEERDLLLWLLGDRDKEGRPPDLVVSNTVLGS